MKIRGRHISYIGQHAMIRGLCLSSIKEGVTSLNITINLWHHMDFVNIHLSGLTTSFSNPALLLLIYA